VLDPAAKKTLTLLAQGIAGIAGRCGGPRTCSRRMKPWYRHQTTGDPVRAETVPERHHGMEVAKGILRRAAA